MYLVLVIKKFIRDFRKSFGMSDCSEYAKLIQLVVDNEATKSEEAYLRKHLENCIRCLELFEVDTALKEALKLRLENKEVPTGLAQAIKDKIKELA